MAEAENAGKPDPVTIKKYANRRLYNTATSSYVTLDHLCKMVQEGIDFVVYDAKTGNDITRPVLTQIIVEEESKGQNLLPITFLRQLIGFYGDNMQWMVPRYLEHMMTVFSTNQDRMRQTMQETFGGMFPFGNIEEMGKQNMVLFENAVKAFSPFAAETEAQGTADTGAQGTDDGKNIKPAAPEADTLEQLKEQVDLLRKQLESLSTQQRAAQGGDRD